MTPERLDQKLGMLGWSQAEVARRLGKSETTFTRWRRAGEIPAYVEAYLDLAGQLKTANEMLAQTLESTA